MGGGLLSISVLPRLQADRANGLRGRGTLFQIKETSIPENPSIVNPFMGNRQVNDCVRIATSLAIAHYLILVVNVILALISFVIFHI